MDETLDVKVLVTGASGLIGRHVIHALLSKGYTVTAIYQTSLPSFSHPRLTWLQKDLVIDSLLELNDPYSFTHLVHCAAAIPSANLKDQASYEINKVIDQNIFAFCKPNEKIRIIYFSSVYIQDYLEKEKERKLTYFQAKIEGEQEMSHPRYNGCIMRISSPYGIGQTTRNVLQIFMEKVVKRENITFFGTGARTQDFISAADVAGAVLKYLETPTGKCTFNVCSSAPVSMKELAYIVQQAYPATDSKVVQSEKPDPQENYRATFDNSDAYEWIKWRPVISLEEGIKGCVTYLSKIA
ncbi:SDR family NAD(P)-dependent oxidoreductase [soil metagenome]